MNKHYLSTLLLIFFFALVTKSGKAQTDSVLLLDSLTNGQIPLFQKFEIGIAPADSVSWNNPYDTRDIHYFAICENAESDTFRVDGFYFIPHIANAEPVAGYSVNWTPVTTNYPFRIRMAFSYSGAYNVKVFRRVNSGDPVQIHSFKLEAIPSDSPVKRGYLHFPEGSKYMSFSNGDPFFAVGINISFYGDQSYRLEQGDKGTPGPGQKGSFVYAPSTLSYYKEKISLAKANGVNFIRIILAPWTFDLEWEGGLTGNYEARQYQLNDLDELFRFCEEQQIYVQMSLYDHTAFKEARELNDPSLTAYCWSNCPYKKEFNLSEPEEFYSNPEAKKRFRQRVQYIYARWGYSTSFAIAELVSEAQQFPDFWGTPEQKYRDNHVMIVNEWHREMAEFCKSLNPDKLLTSGSAGFWGIHQSWVDENMDLASPHVYGSFKNMGHLNATALQAVRKEMQRRGNEQPVQIGESGQSLLIEQNGRTIGCNEHDITQISFHNTAWASAFYGSFGTSIPWSRTELFAEWGPKWGRGYRYFKPVEVFFADEALHEQQWEPVANTPIYSSSINDVPSCHINRIEIVENRFKEVKEDVKLETGVLTNDSKGKPVKDVAVFAIKSSEKILGWVQNMNNYWYNLNGNSANSGGNSHSRPECVPHVLHPQVDTRPRITPIKDLELTFENLECNGIYDVEWWSTYPEFDADGESNSLENGGQITKPQTLLTVDGTTIPTFVESIDGRLTIKVPQLAPLPPFDDYRIEEATLAPDYAFKIIYREGSGKAVDPKWEVRQISDDEMIAGPIITQGESHYVRTSSGDFIQYSGANETEKIAVDNLPFDAEEFNSTVIEEEDVSVSADTAQFFVGQDLYIHYGNPNSEELAENLKSYIDYKVRHGKIGSERIFLTTENANINRAFYIDKKGYLNCIDYQAKTQHRWTNFPFVLPEKSQFEVMDSGGLLFIHEGRLFEFYLDDPCR